MRTADRPIMDERYADDRWRQRNFEIHSVGRGTDSIRLPLDPERDLRLPKPQRSAT